MKPIQLFLLTLLAMLAFAGNSLLCRAALKHLAVDAATFTFIRIASGAVALSMIMQLRRGPVVKAGSWISAGALFAYAATFSFAYNTLAAGTGALLLFGAVQATMILWGWRNGERLSVAQIFGLVLALGGLVWLLFPGLSAPPLGASLLMLSAGIAWGIYSLRGKGTRNPAATTAGNFLRAVPFAAGLALIFLPWAHVDRAGLLYGVLSGAIASGAGYIIWYAALPHLKAASAATVQLSVPVLTASGGILLLGEVISLRFLLASVAILGGIALVVLEKRPAG
ncbi:MAG: DMT family transporter [Chthoniobacterales bacterium]